MKTKHTRKSAALAVRPSEKRDALSKEEFAQRRMGIAAGVQMMVTIERLAETATDERYDGHEQQARDLVTHYLNMFSQQSPAARDGFVYVLTDNLFGPHSGSGVYHGNSHELAHHHANPPLTTTEWCDLCEKYDESGKLDEHHNGKALAPEERKQLAKGWLNPTRPKGMREGRGAAIAFVADLDGANGHSDEVVDSYLTLYSQAGDKARAGFRSILRDVLQSGYDSITIDKADFYAGREFHGGKKGPQGKELAACRRQWLEGGAR